MSYINELLFGLYPYFAFVVFLVGSWARYDREQYTWKAGSSQMLDKKGFRLASNLFHIGVIFIVLGHVVGLLTPHAVYEVFMTSATKQMLAMVAGGIAGVLALWGGILLLKRRLTNPRVRASSSKADILVLSMLVVQAGLGMLTLIPSMQHLDGSVMLELAAWAQGIVTFQGDAATHLAGVSIIYKIHIFLGLSLFVVFPFTRLVHVLSVPVKYFARSYQIVRQRG
ncbi:MAG: respiratory nitrate reductase subunit gamma [Gammaproteobacteria bacterium]|jgi:nitrate reductase gamma subunit|nr:respiratory nitrate reductase subunit gamma [Gammaproteobacteria bacterium]MCP4880887.1 respiratory nitrate reductase subunit gamma [Gammaproteobacteria bacterium]MDP6164505.1 respiratory nitrate reductase subunit gamma [Gammaproteobacteria bacterium]